MVRTQDADKIISVQVVAIALVKSYSLFRINFSRTA